MKNKIEKFEPVVSYSTYDELVKKYDELNRNYSELLDSCPQVLYGISFEVEPTHLAFSISSKKRIKHYTKEDYRELLADYDKEKLINIICSLLSDTARVHTDL